MRKNLKKIVIPVFHLIRFFIESFHRNAIPDSFKKTTTIQKKEKLAHDYFFENELKDCYDHFKKYFYTSLLLDTRQQVRDYAIQEATTNHKTNDYYLEFGVYKGFSINYTANILKKIPIYGFDSFLGLKDDWVGDGLAKGTFNLNGNLPKLNKNVVPVIGFVQDTLPTFLQKHKDMKINYVHMDLDTYSSTKYVLEKIKPFLKNKCTLIFDELYNYPGWKVGEYKALTEVFDESEYNFLCFSKIKKGNAVIQIS